MQDGTLRSRAKEIFLDALEEPQQRRDEFVRRATEGEAALRDAVHLLLSGHEQADAIDGWIPGRPRPEDGLAVGDVLGSYELLAELDSGSAGRVFRARQEGLDREVALKVPNAGRFASPAEVARFRREAEAVAGLDHPGIVPVHDVDEADGRHFFSMKLIEGGSLAERTDEFSDPEAAAALIETVARAVHHAHQRGILHRDIKPSNILLDRRARPFVADFGIAAQLGVTDDASRVAVAGTPAYMAPEQATPGGEPTTASDVWALGCVLFELVEGAPPFRGSGITDSLRKAREEETPRLERARHALPRARFADLEAIVRHCLEKSPAERYGSARALAEDLRRWLGLHHVSVRTPPLTERVQMRWRRQPYAYTFAAALVVLVLGIATVAPLVSVELRRRLNRAEDAEAVARTRLGAALLAQAEATRQSSSPGRRTRALANLAEAAAIAPGPALRDEAIRALARADLEVTGELAINLETEAALCVDGNGRLVVVADGSGGARVVDLVSGETISSASIASGRLRYARLSPSGRWLLGRSHRKTFRDEPVVTLIDLETGEAKRAWRDGAMSPRLAFDATGQRLALSLDDPAIEIVSCDTLETVSRHELATLPSEIVFSPDGLTIYAATGEERSLLRIDVESGEAEILVEDLPHPTSTIDLDPEGERLLVGYYGPTAQLFDTASGQLLAEYRGHAAEVASVGFVNAGIVATSAWDGLTRAWDAATGEILLEWPGHLLPGSSGTAGTIVTVSGDRVERQIVSPSPVVLTLSGHEGKSPRGLASAADGSWVATGAVDGTRIWNPRTGALLFHLEAEDVISMATPADVATLYTSDGHGVTRHDVRPALNGRRPEGVQIVGGRTEDVAVSRDGRRLTVVRPFETVEVYDLAADPPRLLRTLDGPGRIAGLDLSPDGSRLVAGAWRGRGLRCWDTATGAVLFDRLAEDRQVTAIFDARGERVVAVTSSALRVWDADGARAVEQPLPNRRSFESAGRLAADPTGRWIAAVVDRDTIELRDPASLELEARLWCDGAPLQSLEFVADSSLLVAGTTDGRALVWDLERLEAELGLVGLALPAR